MRAPLQTGAHGVGDEWEGAPAGWVPLGSAQTRGGGGTYGAVYVFPFPRLLPSLASRGHCPVVPPHGVGGAPAVVGAGRRREVEAVEAVAVLPSPSGRQPNSSR